MNAIVEDWGHLRDFLALVRGGTLAKAGESLDVDPSTVFRRINALEEALGTMLFERRGRGYVLTAAGDSLVTHASRVEEQVLNLERDMVGRDRALGGTIRVTTTDTLALGLLGPYFRALQEAYPDIHLDLLLDSRVFRLGRGEADVAIRPGRRPTEGDVVPREVSRIASAFYASKRYLEAAGRPRRKSDLAKHRFVDLGDSLAHVPYARQAAELAPSAPIVFRSSSLMAQVMAVEEGLGIGLLPCFLADRNPTMVRLFASEVDSDSAVWIVVHRDLRHMARIRAFVDFMTECIASDRDLLEGRRRRPNLSRSRD